MTSPLLDAKRPALRGGREGFVLDVIWSALPERKWISREALKEAAGTDEDTLTRIINFLTRWDFIESRASDSAEHQLRRREGAIDLLKAANLLQQVTAKGPSRIVTGSRRVVERLACRICGGKSLSYAGGNMVECSRCHEQQWYAIDVSNSSFASENWQRSRFCLHES